MTPEGRVKDKIKKMLKDLNIVAAKDAAKPNQVVDGWYFMPVPTGMGVRGIPDFVGCFYGRFFAIEAKAPNGKVTALQQYQINAINESNGQAFIISLKDEDYDEFKAWCTMMRGY